MAEDLALMAHLLRRAGFGVPRDELEMWAEKGYEQTVEELLDPEKYGIADLDRDEFFRYYPDMITPAAPPGSGEYMVYHIMASPRHLLEKMTLFWHMLFATGNGKVDGPVDMTTYYDTMRKHALGNYREMLMEISKNPAMIFWLDNNYNHKDQPNENWGRELLELFSMGQGNYTEKDVFECARAFTGWTIAAKPPRRPFTRFPWKFEYVEDDHDDGEKELLGHKGRFNGEDVINIVCRQPATARFMARHLYNYFVADEVQVPSWLDVPPRDPVAINIIGDAFMNSDFDIKHTLRVLFNSDFFKEARHMCVKSPAEVIAGTMRLIGDYKFPRPGLNIMSMESEFMGQMLLNPPSVEGWHFGAEWIDSGSLVRRINFCAEAVSNTRYPGIRAIVERIKAKGTISGSELVESCLDLLGPIAVEEGTRTELDTLAEQAGPLTWEPGQEEASTQRVGDMLALIASTREYQFA